MVTILFFYLSKNVPIHYFTQTFTFQTLSIIVLFCPKLVDHIIYSDKHFVRMDIYVQKKV